MSKQVLDDWYQDIADLAAEYGWDWWKVRQQLDALTLAEARYIVSEGEEYA